MSDVPTPREERLALQLWQRGTVAEVLAFLKKRLPEGELDYVAHQAFMAIVQTRGAQSPGRVYCHPWELHALTLGLLMHRILEGQARTMMEIREKSEQQEEMPWQG